MYDISILTRLNINDFKLISCSILIGCVLLQGCERSPKKTYAENITINDCWFEQKDDWPLAECGVLLVPENYSKPDGREVKLPFIIFKATEPDQKTYPLVVAGGGGPGGALGIAEENKRTFNDTAWLGWYSSTIEAGRDLVLIDNRGVGSSEPRLDCYEVEKADMDSLNKHLNIEDVIKITKESFGDCKQRLVDQGIDLSQYHVVNAARDLEELRIGLGLDQLNVYGISYGTRVALELERRYPDSVRSLILDGIYPQSVKAYEDAPRHDSEAITRVINKCQEESECFSQFGFNLEESFTTFLKQLDEKPVTISMTSPVDYQPIDVVVTSDIFFDSLFAMIYDEYAIAYIPKYMYSTFKGNTDLLTEMVRDYYVNDIVIDPMDAGAYVSYSCFDEIPFIDYTVARDEIKKYPYQHYSSKYAIEIVKTLCEVWDVPAAASDFKDEYTIDTPVLIYSGELDPVTPAEFAKPVIKNARKSWHMEWPNIAHGVMYTSDCSDWTAGAFLGNPESDPFVYECSDEPRMLDFEIR